VKTVVSRKPSAWHLRTVAHLLCSIATPSLSSLCTICNQIENSKIDTIQHRVRVGTDIAPIFEDQNRLTAAKSPDLPGSNRPVVRGVMVKTCLDCYPCFVRQALEAARFAVEEDQDLQLRILHRILNELQAFELADSPPAMAYRGHRIIQNEIGDPDPYRSVKQANTAQDLRLPTGGLVPKHNMPDRGRTFRNRRSTDHAM